jgi:hypothetical protein
MARVAVDLTIESGLIGRVPLLALLGLLGWPTVAPLAGGQFTSGVNVVEVYATVTDKAGNPVKGLTRGQFTVREAGEPQEISTFAAGGVSPCGRRRSGPQLQHERRTARHRQVGGPAVHRRVEA